MTAEMGDSPQALVESDATPVVLRVKVGYYFDVMGVLDLHASGNVTATPYDPSAATRDAVRSGYLLCWQGDESRASADILRELPTRWRSYMWAGVVFDYTDTSEREQVTPDGGQDERAGERSRGDAG